MNTNDAPLPPIRILFVCFANLCRSPLAELIAGTRFPGRIEARSAGVSPGNSGPFEEAIDVARRIYGRNIAGHRPRHVLEFPIADFDYIIALDSAVFIRLAHMPEIPQEKLFGWEIADPCGLGVETYEQTARTLETEIGKFLDQLDLKRPFRGRS
jgi:protein-tyrosine-phosphatase